MKFRIGYRTIKSAIGATAAIMLAQLLGLENYASAGILTILCIGVTKKESLRAAWERVLTCIIGIVFAIVFFELIGYESFVIGLILLLFIPTLVMFHAGKGVANSTVIILHFFAKGSVTFPFILNELAIIFIGTGMALLVNLYIPSVDHKLVEYQNKIEANFKKIFLEIVRFLREGSMDWDGKELSETVTLLKEAKSISVQVMENHLLQQADDLYYTYFNIREKQLEIFERVLPSVTSIAHTVEQGKMIADFLEELAEHIHGGNTADLYLGKLYKMQSEFQNMELPQTREEFEIRAALFHFIKEMEQYLLIKQSFKGLEEKTRKQLKIDKNAI